MTQLANGLRPYLGIDPGDDAHLLAEMYKGLGSFIGNDSVAFNEFEDALVGNLLTLPTHEEAERFESSNEFDEELTDE
eukprot:CAMPEP_0198224382 /NCGR_PEP_ID=MMETSP1445-20131203/96687_1 /TAXON_ID=36898 /ORGANISM="Pyramimonas sp., Strain CCMP2087" /LENGTH=77 /DNA_ID=CAMNT_0043903537 /DNA_START=18 /DNA_END=251 /DNA_ORIENTATION=-